MRPDARPRDKGESNTKRLKPLTNALPKRGYSRTLFSIWGAVVDYVYKKGKLTASPKWVIFDVNDQEILPSNVIGRFDKGIHNKINRIGSYSQVRRLYKIKLWW
jgi:hypothetical protein